MSQDKPSASHHPVSFAVKKSKAVAGGTPLETKGWTATHFPDEFAMMVDDDDFTVWAHMVESDRNVPEREHEREREREASHVARNTVPQQNPDETAGIPAAHRNLASFARVLRDAFNQVLTFCRPEDVENIAQVNRAWRGAVTSVPATTVVLKALAPQREAAQRAGRSADQLAKELRVEAGRRTILSTQFDPKIKLMDLYTSGVLDSDLLMRETRSILGADRISGFTPGIQYCAPLECLHLAARNTCLSPAVIMHQSAAILAAPIEKLPREDQLAALRILFECGRHHLNPALVGQQCEIIRAMVPAPAPADRNMVLKTLYRYGSISRELLESESAALIAGDDLRHDRTPLQLLYRSASRHLDADLLVRHSQRILALDATRQPQEMLAALIWFGRESLTPALVAQLSTAIMATLPRLGSEIVHKAMIELYKAAQPLMNDAMITQESAAILATVPGPDAVKILGALHFHATWSLTPDLMASQSATILAAFATDADHARLALGDLYGAGKRHLGDALLTQESAWILAFGAEGGRSKMLSALYEAAKDRLTPDLITRQCDTILARLPDGVTPALETLVALLEAGSAHLNAAMIRQLSVRIRSAHPALDAHKLLSALYHVGKHSLSHELLVSESREILASHQSVGGLAAAIAIAQLYQASPHLLTDTRITQQSAAILELAPGESARHMLALLYGYGKNSFTAELLNQQSGIVLAALPQLANDGCTFVMKQLYQAGKRVMNAAVIVQQSAAIRGLHSNPRKQPIPDLLEELYLAAGSAMSSQVVAAEQHWIVEAFDGATRERLWNALLQKRPPAADTKGAQ